MSFEMRWVICRGRELSLYINNVWQVRFTREPEGGWMLRVGCVVVSYLLYEFLDWADD